MTTSPLAQLGRLSDLVVGTTGGVRRAAAVLVLLVIGLFLQLADLAGLPSS